MNDKIFEAFLQRQLTDGMALTEASDILDLTPVHGSPPQHYIAEFQCHGLAWRDGQVVEADYFAIGLSFPLDYLRRPANPAQILTWLAPKQVWHPNIAPPVICVGRIPPGTGLVDLLYQIFEIITYQKVTPREDDALNKAACAWARHNMDRFPIDPRPLKRRPVDRVAPSENGG